MSGVSRQRVERFSEQRTLDDFRYLNGSTVSIEAAFIHCSRSIICRYCLNHTTYKVVYNMRCRSQLPVSSLYVIVSTLSRSRTLYILRASGS